MFIGMGWAVGVRKRERYLLEADKERIAAAGDRVGPLVDRLCLIGGIEPPELEVECEDAPLTWTTDLPGRPPRLHVTTGLVEALPVSECEAVLAHELAHIANRDVIVTTTLSIPGIFVLRGLRAMSKEGLDEALGALVFGIFMAPVAAVFAVTGRIVSRQREFAADRGAALLTGDPTALASALRRITGALDRIPKKDLRKVATHQPLNLLPAREAKYIGRLWATHPRLKKRLRRLEELERVRHVPGAAAQL